VLSDLRDGTKKAETCHPPMMYMLFCAILGQQTDAFTVEIDDTWTVSELKEGIKKVMPQTLGSFDNNALTLYKVDIDISDDDNEAYLRAIDQIHRNMVTTKELLGNPTHKLSAKFGQSIPEGRIHILVQSPLGQSIDLVNPRVWCVAETINVSAKRKREEVEPDTPSKRLREGLLCAALAVDPKLILEPRA